MARKIAQVFDSPDDQFEQEYSAWSDESPLLRPPDDDEVGDEGPTAGGVYPQALQAAFSSSSPSSAGPTSDPFTAMGGGVQVNGGWVPRDHPLAGSATPSSVSGSGAAPPPASIQDAYRTALQGMLTGPSPQQAGQDVLKSPAYTAAAAAAKKQEARDRALLAERAAAGGFSGSGAFDTGVLGLRQSTNEALSRFAGEQAGESERGRRQELLQAMALASAMGDNEAARAIQRELGLANVDVARAGVGAQQDRLGFDYAQLQNQMNQNALAQLLGGF